MLPRASSSRGKFTTVFRKFALQPYSGTPLDRVLKHTGHFSHWERDATQGLRHTHSMLCKTPRGSGEQGLALEGGHTDPVSLQVLVSKGSG